MYVGAFQSVSALKVSITQSEGMDVSILSDAESTNLTQLQNNIHHGLRFTLSSTG